MKIKFTKGLKEKVASLKSRVKEPAHFEKWRTRLYIFTIIFCLGWLPFKFIYMMGADAKATFFFCGMSMTGLILLTSMIKPGSKSFWVIFLNILITLPIVFFYLPLDEAIRHIPILGAFFGLLPLWIPKKKRKETRDRKLSKKKKHRSTKKNKKR